MDEIKLRGKAKRKYMKFFYKMNELIEETKTPSGNCVYCYFMTKNGTAFRVSPSNIGITVTETYGNDKTPVCDFTDIDSTNAIQNQSGQSLRIFDPEELTVINEAEFRERWNTTDRVNKSLWAALPVGETYYQEFYRSRLNVIRDKYSERKILNCGLEENHYYLLVDAIPNFPESEESTRNSIPIHWLFNEKPIIGVGITFKKKDGLPIYELYKKFTGKE